MSLLPTQLTFTCLKSTIKILEKSVNMLKVNDKSTNFEEVNVSWEHMVCYKKNGPILKKILKERYCWIAAEISILNYSRYETIHIEMDISTKYIEMDTLILV